jgi:ABC-type Mn2+/Zn2+ transport system permease subunit
MFEIIATFKDALYGALVIGIACSVLGVYVVLRRIVFVGAALAELSSMGIALGFWLAGNGIAMGLATHPVAMSLIVTMGGVVFFAMSTGRSIVPPDATIGLVYAVAAAVGIILISKAATGEAHDIFLQGNILGITRKDAWTLAGIAAPVLLLHAVYYKEFLFVSFDRETARTLGFRVDRWNLLLYLTLGLVIAFAMQFAGVMLVFNFLVLPAVTGILLGGGMRIVFAGAVVSAIIAATVGFTVSVPFDLPTGPAIIAVSGILAGLAWFVARLQPAR